MHNKSTICVFFRLRLQKTSSRRLQNVLIKTNIFALVIRLRKTSSRRLQDILIKTNIFVLVIRLRDVFKTFLARLQDVLETSSKRLQDIFKTSCKDVFKTSSRRLAKMSSRHLQDVFKTYHLVKLFLLTRLQNVIETYSARFWDVLRRWLFTERFAWLKPLRNLWSGKKISRSELFGFTEILKTVFLKHFMK